MAQKLPIRLRTVAAAIVVVASGLIIFNVYQSIIGSSDSTLQALPIISAPSQPFRVLPDDPGGAEIPNQGSKLYNVMDENQPDPLALGGASLLSDAKDQTKPDNLFDDDQQSDGAVASGFELPQAPATRTESLYGMIEDLKDRPVNDEDNVAEAGVEPMNDDDKKELKEKLAAVIEKAEQEMNNKDTIEKSLEKPVEKTETATTPTTNATVSNAENKIDALILPRPSIKPNPPVRKAVAVAPIPTEKKANKQNTDAAFSLDRVLNAVPTEKHYIQLASLRDETSAKNAYAQIKNDFPALVGGLGVVYPSVDLGARGTFVRVQVGPVSEAEAKRRCADYVASSRGGTCLVVRR